jgi:hypothetical protein
VGTETTTYDQTKVDGPLELVVNTVQLCERRYHDAFVEKVERRYAAYRGLSDTPDDPVGDDWHSNVTTPYVMNTCEGMLATMLEPNPRFNVQPRPRPDEPLEEVVARVQVGQRDRRHAPLRARPRHFAEKQRDFMQQDLIAGISVLKTFWKTERRTSRSSSRARSRSPTSRAR